MSTDLGSSDEYQQYVIYKENHIKKIGKKYLLSIIEYPHLPHPNEVCQFSFKVCPYKVEILLHFSSNFENSKYTVQ